MKVLNIKDTVMEPRLEEQQTYFISKDYSVKASGTFLQFLIFFERIGNSTRIYNVKSLKLTAYLEKLLDLLAAEQAKQLGNSLFSIITPREPEARGAQLSVKLKPGLLDSIMETLEENGVVVDERKPDVVRVAPAPLYNSFEDVRKFIVVFRDACVNAAQASNGVANGKASE